MLTTAWAAKTTYTTPLGVVTTTAYDGVGNVTSVTTPATTSTTTYDALNRVSTTSDGVNTSYISYWPDGQIMDQTDGNGVVTHNDYNWVAKQITITYGYGSTSPLDMIEDIDAVANTTKITDPLSHSKTYTLDN